MELILARHGNTFNKGDKVFWVGRNEDLPLTSDGEKQALNVAKELASKSISAVYCAPLLRTRRFAEIITSTLSLAPAIEDERLLEVDYGTWAGKSNEEVAELGTQSAEQLTAWVDEGIWPPRGVWGSEKHEIEEAILGFASDIRKRHTAGDNIVVVTSNGCIRFFLELVESVPNEIQESHGKVKTGAMCSITDNGETYTLNYWNKRPQE